MRKKGKTDQFLPVCPDFVTRYTNQNYVNIQLFVPIPEFEELHPEKESPQSEFSTPDLYWVHGEQE